MGPLVRYTVYTEPQGVRKLRCAVWFPWTTAPDGGLLMDVLENKKHGVKHDPTSGEKMVEALVRWEDHEASWLRGIYDPQSGEKTRAPLQDEEKDFRVVGRIRYLDRDDFITRDERLVNPDSGEAEVVLVPECEGVQYEGWFPMAPDLSLIHI